MRRWQKKTDGPEAKRIRCKNGSDRSRKAENTGFNLHKIALRKKIKKVVDIPGSRW